MTLCILLILLIIGGVLGLMIGFFVMDEVWGTSNFILLFSIILIVFWFFLLVAVYLGGKIKLSNERKMIQESLQKMKLKQANAE